MGVLEGKLEKPEKVCCIWDNKGKSIDRYTVFLKDDENGCLCLSENPDQSQGVSSWSQYDVEFHKNAHSKAKTDLLGKEMKFKNLPVNVQEYIVDRIRD